MPFESMTHEEEPVCGAWQRFVQAVLILFLAITALVLLPILFPRWFPRHSTRLEDQVRILTEQVRLLEREQEMPSLVLNRYRNSICYIFGIYQIGFPGEKPLQRTRISGSGFLVAGGLI